MVEKNGFLVDNARTVKDAHQLFKAGGSRAGRNFIILHGQRILLQRRWHYPVDWRISIQSRRQTSAAEKLMNWRFIKRICNV